MAIKKRNGESDIALPLGEVLGDRNAESTYFRKEAKSIIKKKLKKGAKSSGQRQVAKANQAQTSIEPQANADIALIQEYMAILSRDFGLKFSQPGESAIHQLELDAQGQYVQGRLLTVRLPRLEELKALHRAIELSQTSNKQLGDEKNTLVMFIDGDLIKGEENGARIKFSEDHRPMLFISPSLSKSGVPTELDRRHQDPHESWQVTLMREFAWKSAADAGIFPLHQDDYRKLGWWPLMPEDFSGLYSLKTKTGAFYAPYEGGVGTAHAWARCDHDGVLLNSEGDPVTDLRDVAFLSNKEMAKHAEVRPCGDLFLSAEEELVDALRCYRQSPEWRIHLELYCPELYNAVLYLEQRLGNEK